MYMVREDLYKRVQEFLAECAHAGIGAISVPANKLWGEMEDGKRVNGGGVETKTYLSDAKTITDYDNTPIDGRKKTDAPSK